MAENNSNEEKDGDDQHRRRKQTVDEMLRARGYLCVQPLQEQQQSHDDRGDGVDTWFVALRRIPCSSTRPDNVDSGSSSKNKKKTTQTTGQKKAYACRFVKRVLRKAHTRTHVAPLSRIVAVAASAFATGLLLAATQFVRVSCLSHEVTLSLRTVKALVGDRRIAIPVSNDRLLVQHKPRKLTSHGIHHILLVPHKPRKLTSHVRKYVHRHDIEVFDQTFFDRNITQHCLFVPHRVVARVPARVVDEERLPRLLQSDPVVRFFGWPTGTLVEIDRTGKWNLPCRTQHMYYRRVVAG